MSFDIEEWFHLVGVKSMADRSRWDAMQRTVEPLTDRILAMLDDHDVRATFFVLGWVAERYPALVGRIAQAGHEIGSHSYWHREIYTQSPSDFRKDLAQSIDVLEQSSGRRVMGFRAPSFSLTPGCEWAWDALLDAGLVYDASVFPVARAHGGYPLATGASEAGVRLAAPSGRVIAELPMSVTRLPMVRRKIAFSGGGYFRVLPWRLVQRGFSEHDAAGKPAVLYLHPWDFAPDGPTLPMKRFQRFKCYRNRDQTEPRLRALLQRYRFDTCAAVLGLAHDRIAKPLAA